MKNFLIIGASSGIGEALCSILEKESKVIGTYNENRKENSGNTCFQHLNVLDENMNLNFLPEVLDGFIYCPGSINLKPFHRIKPSEFVDDFQLQVIGAIKIIQTILPNLKKAEHPSILLFSTVAVQNGFNFHSQVSTSKGAIEGLTHALAAEFAPKIRVNCIAPSLTDTPLAAKLLNTDEKKEANAQRHPLKQIGTAKNIAEMAAFLISEKSFWISGQVIHVDGGLSSIKN